MLSLQERHKKLLLALFIAILLWAYVTNQTEEFFSYAESRTESFLLDIEVINLAENLNVTEMSRQKAVVRLDYVFFFRNLKKEEIEVYVNLQDAASGDNIRMVKVNLPTGVTLRGIDPSYVTLTIEEVDK